MDINDDGAIDIQDATSFCIKISVLNKGGVVPYLKRRLPCTVSLQKGDDFMTTACDMKKKLWPGDVVRVLMKGDAPPDPPPVPPELNGTGVNGSGTLPAILPSLPDTVEKKDFVVVRLTSNRLYLEGR